jgi:hypothetical protein
LLGIDIRSIKPTEMKLENEWNKSLY